MSFLSKPGRFAKVVQIQTFAPLEDQVLHCAMETAAHAPAAAFGDPAARYEALLQQIVQLNADLQKTASLSQTLQRERDGIAAINTKVYF